MNLIEWWARRQAARCRRSNTVESLTDIPEGIVCSVQVMGR
jgi:hypothetical protein